ncbi:MAG: winged helix DNA-binding domain-containing protein [Bacteroidetes bacterium]|nr:winged helix DNA-binding domain-containing protein [Bacteroidota bacterium]
MKNSKHTLSREQAQLLALNSQGLSQPNFGKGKKGTLAAIDLLGYVQIDTLSVVARAHHHTLWSRLPDYNENFLNDLLEKDKTIFEYWSHAASYLPMSDYRFSLPRKKSYEDGKSHWFGQDKKMNKYVLDRIKAEGPLQSKDFEYKREGPGNWYEWKPAKRALEQLFMEGKLMVAKRQRFHKVYDLTACVLPSIIDTSFPTEKEYSEHLILKAVQAHGFVSEKEISYLRNGLKVPINKTLKRMLMEGELVEVKIEREEKLLFITSANQLKDIEKIKLKNNIHFLSPFDNAIIQRKRVQFLFDFDYMVECYLPEPKRRYGYFCLPVLHGNKLVARFDPKADRAAKIFYIKSMHFEKEFKPTIDFNLLFVSKLKDFAAFNGCTKIVIEKADKNWKKDIMSLLTL